MKSSLKSINLRREATAEPSNSLRSSIEARFKEIKQNLGFLKKQSGRYQIASRHVMMHSSW